MVCVTDHTKGMGGKVEVTSPKDTRHFSWHSMRPAHKFSICSHLCSSVDRSILKHTKNALGPHAGRSWLYKCNFDDASST